MKKNLIFILICLCLVPSFAFAEKDEFDSGYDAFTRARNLKPVSEQEVQQVLKALEAKKAEKAMKKKHWWSKSTKSKKMDGASLSKQGNDSNNANVIAKPYLLIQLNDKLLGKDSIIPPGFYTIDFKKDSQTLVLQQGHSPIAEIKMFPSFSPTEFEELYYIKTKREKENIRFMYGEIDKHYEGFCRIMD